MFILFADKEHSVIQTRFTINIEFGRWIWRTVRVYIKTLLSWEREREREREECFFCFATETERWKFLGFSENFSPLILESDSRNEAAFCLAETQRWRIFKVKKKNLSLLLRRKKSLFQKPWKIAVSAKCCFCLQQKHRYLRSFTIMRWNVDRNLGFFTESFDIFCTQRSINRGSCFGPKHQRIPAKVYLCFSRDGDR